MKRAARVYLEAYTSILLVPKEQLVRLCAGLIAGLVTRESSHFLKCFNLMIMLVLNALALLSQTNRRPFMSGP